MFPSTPFVKLGQNFRHLAELLRRFGSIPDILELDHLSVSGDVTFGKQVSRRASNEGSRIFHNHGEGSCLGEGLSLVGAFSALVKSSQTLV